MKKMMSLILAVVMLLVLTVGCGTTGDTGKSTTAATVASTQAAASQETTTATAALEPVKLIWYLRSDNPVNGDAVVKKANELISKEINATVDFKFVAPGNYDDKMNLILQSSEEFDICFTSSWANDYVKQVNKGAYIPLDKYVEQYPAIKALISDKLWDAIKIQDKIYAIPNLQVMYNQMGLWFRKDMVDKYQLDVSSDAIKTVNDLTPIFQKIKDNEKDMYPLIGYPAGDIFVASVPTLDQNMGVDTKTWKVYDRESTDDLANYYAIREWQKKGFFPSDAATIKDTDPLIKAGKVFCRYSRILPGVEATVKNTYGFDVVTLATTEPIIEQNSVRSTMNAISITSKNPDRAAMLLNLMNTNKEVYNTMVFGIENVDYKKISDNRIEQIAGGYSSPAVVPSWQLGNQFNAYVVPGQTDDVWEQTKKMNDSARIQDMGSFSFNEEKVKSQSANIHAVRKEYGLILDFGLDDVDKTMAARAAKLKTAGIDAYLAEMQAQVDEWVKANVK